VAAVRRPLVLVPLIALFVVVALGLARVLTQENDERDHLEQLVTREARGDADGVLALLRACDPACAAKVRAFVPRVSGAGAADPKIVRLDSDTAYSLGTSEGWSRVVWVRTPESRPVVQCVRVRREGGPFAGRTITLLRVTAPLADNEQSC
jgi:hypothetical protein